MAVEAPGGRELPVWQLVRLAQALHLTLADLLGNDPLPPITRVRWETLP